LIDDNLDGNFYPQFTDGYKNWITFIVINNFIVTRETGSSILNNQFW